MKVRTKAGLVVNIIGSKETTKLMEREGKKRRVRVTEQILLGYYDIDGPHAPLREVNGENIAESLLPPLKPYLVNRMVFSRKCKQGKDYNHQLVRRVYSVRAVSGAEAGAMADHFKYEEERALGHHGEVGSYCWNAPQRAHARH